MKKEKSPAPATPPESLFPATGVRGVADSPPESEPSGSLAGLAELRSMYPHGSAPPELEARVSAELEATRLSALTTLRRAGSVIAVMHPPERRVRDFLDRVRGAEAWVASHPGVAPPEPQKGFAEAGRLLREHDAARAGLAHEYRAAWQNVVDWVNSERERERREVAERWQHGAPPSPPEVRVVWTDSDRAMHVFDRGGAMSAADFLLTFMESGLQRERIRACKDCRQLHYIPANTPLWARCPSCQRRHRTATRRTQGARG